MDERYEDGYDPKYGYNRNAFVYKPPHLGLLSRVVKLVTTPIALASEAVAHHQQKSDTKSTPPETLERNNTFVELPQEQANALIQSGQAVPADDEQPTHELVDRDERDDDEADWALDEAASKIDEPGQANPSQPGEADTQPSIEELVVEIHPSEYTPVQSTEGKATLPFPVVLPQRRPRTKTRGFVRAYAPVLSDFGIDQPSFLDFLNGLHKAAQAYPVFEVIQISAAIAGVYPDPVVALSMQAAQIIVGFAAEMQERWNTNKFLDRANKEIFIPRGLYCMIVTYKPAGAEEVGSAMMKKTVDLAAPAVAKYGEHLIRETSTGSAAGADSGG